MLVFISIYAERHASRARELLKYVSVVRTAAECGYNWKDYDVQFRLRHARQPHMSWAKVDTELWLLVATAQMRNFRTYSNTQSAVWSPPPPPLPNGAGDASSIKTLAECAQPAPASASPSTPGGARGENTVASRTNVSVVATPLMVRHHAQNPPQASRELAPTPIQLERMLPFLHTYDNQAAARRLINGFTHGFPLGYVGARVPMSAKKLKSAFDHPQIVKTKIEKGVELGRIVGPFSSPPFQNFRCSPIGVVPKRTPGEFRLIRHLSSPRGSSVNDNIDREECSVAYSSFDEAVALVVSLGQHAYMGKADIKSAFR